MSGGMARVIVMTSVGEKMLGVLRCPGFAFSFLFVGQLSPSSVARCDRSVLILVILLSFIENGRNRAEL